MAIDLKPEQQRVIDLAVQSGAYRDPGEVLDQAFEIIREQLDLEDWMFGQRDAVAAHIEVGFSQAQRGELIEGDAAVEMLRRRRAERLKPREWMLPFSSRRRRLKTSILSRCRWSPWCMESVTRKTFWKSGSEAFICHSTPKFLKPSF